jgi:hypothetical protein
MVIHWMIAFSSRSRPIEPANTHDPHFANYLSRQMGELAKRLGSSERDFVMRRFRDNDMKELPGQITPDGYALYVTGFGPDETADTLWAVFRDLGRADVLGVELGEGLLGRSAYVTTSDDPKKVIALLDGAWLNKYQLCVTRTYRRAQFPINNQA